MTRRHKSFGGAHTAPTAVDHSRIVIQRVLARIRVIQIRTATRLIVNGQLNTAVHVHSGHVRLLLGH